MLDMNLNGTKSHAVADALAARGVPFIFSTGYSAHDMREGYRDRPVLKKPFKFEELIEKSYAPYRAKKPMKIIANNPTTRHVLTIRTTSVGRSRKPARASTAVSTVCPLSFCITTPIARTISILAWPY